MAKQWRNRRFDWVPVDETGGFGGYDMALAAGMLVGVLGAKKVF